MADADLRPPLPVAAYTAAIRTDTDLLASAAAEAGWAAPVPTCPGWTVRDLVRHLGGVHRWATGFVAESRAEKDDRTQEELVGGWPDDGDLGRWFLDGAERLATALDAASPDLRCWTFLRAPSPRVHWARRQAHETAIHRVDAEAA
ncbi:MAG TPA: maleylpyruvate isomerase N-terminal domain-containing protein, partial [Ilumatobacteraceae bacterium]|nr:maleylpyruvate isomerase N-terminal domain-containing protein [Ilumatobacteraceae bacterium]